MNDAGVITYFLRAGPFDVSLQCESKLILIMELEKLDCLTFMAKRSLFDDLHFFSDLIEAPTCSELLLREGCGV